MDYANQSFLITGGTGFLGTNIIRAIINKKNVPPENIRVFFLEGTSTSSIDDIKGLKLIPGDILNKSDVNEACKDVSYVFHTAGITTFEPRAKKIQWLVNVEGTRNLVEIAHNSKSIKKICYTSTVNVLGAPTPFGTIGTIETSDPYENEHKVHSFDSTDEILNFADDINSGKAQKKWWKKIGIGYHNSKLAAQEIVNRAVRDLGLDIVSVLPGTFFGPYDDFIGPGLYLVQVYRNRMPGALKTGFALCHVEDVVKGHLLAMEKGQKGSRYIITGMEDDNRYLKEMLKIIAGIIKEREPEKKVKEKFITFSFFMAKIGAFFSELYSKIFKKPCTLSKAMIKAASYPSFYSFEKAKQELGYNPQKTFREAIEDMYEYYKEKGYFSKKGRQMDKIILEKKE